MISLMFGVAIAIAGRAGIADDHNYQHKGAQIYRSIAHSVLKAAESQ
ncbi:hypothetical protein [Sphingobium sp. MK2]